MESRVLESTDEKHELEMDESLQVVVDAVVAEPLSHDCLDAFVGLTLGSERPLADGAGGGHGGSAGSASGLLAVLLNLLHSTAPCKF